MKYRNMLILISSCLVFLGYGCASKVYKHLLLSIEGQRSSAEVYFFRDETLKDSAFATPVELGGESLLRLRRATYAKVYLKPGSYDIAVGSYSGGRGLFSSVPAIRSMTFDAGKIYFIHLKPESRATLFGFETYFKPELITEEQARILMTQYTLIPGPGD